MHETDIRKDRGNFKFLKNRESKEDFLNATAKTHIVVEKRGRQEDDELELEFRRICSGGNYEGEQFPFEVIFADKKSNSAGLQLADLVARPVGINILRPEQKNRAFDVLKAKFYTDRDGRHEGGGLKCFP